MSVLPQTILKKKLFLCGPKPRTDKSLKKCLILSFQQLKLRQLETWEEIWQRCDIKLIPSSPAFKVVSYFLFWSVSSKCIFITLNKLLVMRRWSLHAYSEASRTSKMELIAKIVNGWKPLTVFAKRFILDVWLGSEYASEVNHPS